MKSINDLEFLEYGKVLNFDTNEIVEYLLKKAKMPIKNNIYVPHEEDFYALKSVKEIENIYFGQLSLQAGYCNGFNTKLNCMEFHATHEINVAATDLVLILGKYSDIKEGKVNVEDLKIFKMKKGEAVLIYPGTLHYSPCRLSDLGFKMSVFLHKGTNLPLVTKTEDSMLWQTNKWLIAHEESVPAQNGAYIGLIGENIEIKY